MLLTVIMGKHKTGDEEHKSSARNEKGRHSRPFIVV